MKKLFAILPCYNEEENISELLSKFVKLKDRLANEYACELKIVCVDDGSADKTAELVQASSAVLLAHEHNMGLGNAVKTGLNYFHEHAQDGDYAVLMDADNTHDPKYVFSMLDKQEADCVIASRYRRGSKTHGVPPHRLLMCWGARILYQTLLRVPNVRDYTCGYRLYSYTSINNLKQRFGDDYITHSGFDCMAELLYKLHMSGTKFAETPFVLRYDHKCGVSKMPVTKTAFGSLALIAELRNMT